MAASFQSYSSLHIASAAYYQAFAADLQFGSDQRVLSMISIVSVALGFWRVVKCNFRHGGEGGFLDLGIFFRLLGHGIYIFFSSFLVRGGRPGTLILHA